MSFTPNSNGAPEPDNISEAWSAAARAAAAAARKSGGRTAYSGSRVRSEVAKKAFAAAGGKRKTSPGELLRRAQVSDLRKNLYPDYGPRSWEKASYKKAIATRKASKARRGLGPLKYFTPTGRLRR